MAQPRRFLPLAAKLDCGFNRTTLKMCCRLPCDRSRDLFRRDGGTHERNPGRDLFLPAGPAAVGRSLEGLVRLIWDAATLVC